MATEIIDLDIAVVGTGILGLAAADLIARSHRSVTVFDCGNSVDGIPARDSQRNHKWLQSGLLYAARLGTDFAMKMWSSGGDLLEFAAMGKRPSGLGIFRFRVDEADEFLTLVSDCRLDGEVSEIGHDSARGYLGPLFEDHYRHFRVPDVPFAESELLGNLYRRAVSTRKVGFVNDSVELQRGQGDDVLIRTPTAAYRGTVTVVCAGWGTPTLLDQLGVPHQVRVYSSPLIRMYDPEPHGLLTGFRADLLVDRSCDLSIVKSIVPEAAATCLIIGNGRKIELTPAQLLSPRRHVSTDDRLSLTQLLPKDLRKWAEDSPATAGYKTEVIDGQGRPSVRPWVHRFEEVGLPRLIVALPGKATLALDAAREVLDRLPAPPRIHYPPNVFRAPPTASPDFRHHSEFIDIDESTNE